MSDTDRDATIRARLEETGASLDAATATNDAALDALGPAPGMPSPVISDPLALDIAIASAAPGAVLILATSLVYPGPLTLRRPITLESETYAARQGVRMTADEPTPRFLNGVAFAGDETRGRGLDIRHTNHATDLVTMAGARVELDRLRIVGDPVQGAKRGIAANGGGDCRIIRCYVDDCFGPYPDPNGNDRQAIGAWTMRPGLLIEDNFLRGGTETLMIGGADPEDEAHLPADIIIRGNLITKRREWQAMPVAVKNTLELKNARRVLIVDNDLEYSWARGQTGYLVMLTPRNQEGRAPFSTVEDVEIVGNRLAHAAAAISLLGTDDQHPSGRLSRIHIQDNRFTDLDPALYAGSQKMILIQRGPLDVRIVDNHFEGKNLTSQVYFDGLPKAEALVVSGNTWPKTKYGIFGSGATINQAWTKYVASGTLGPNQEI